APARPEHYPDLSTTRIASLRHQSSITSLSWIPSEAVEGSMRIPFDAGMAHYDPPPPETIGDLEALRDEDRFRFANILDAWIDVDEKGKIKDFGYSGGGMMGSTTVKMGPVARTFEAIGLPTIQKKPEKGRDFVRFVQTTGGRTGVPAPRRVRRKPFIQWQAPLVWTTLTLTIYADGRAEGAMDGASRFPRHWVYDKDGQLSHKSGLADFKDWYRKSFGRHTPWGDQESKALVTAVETALERRLSEQVMRGGEKPTITKVKAGTTLVRQGDRGTEVFLLLDGVLRVEHDGERLAEYGPGAMLGERAHLEDGLRTSSLVAVTPCRVASVKAEQLERGALHELSKGHRREGKRPKKPVRG
ncbi:MAG TPA: cyclic nucleotide-binding domain-containing protein, partial [Solirubrobacteraceae bacterium]|nr:cyclic nucleotide-binding domain-containing protein [Solirubrobacteraceae bacterium]